MPSESRRTSATARLSPFAPVAGTMCAASPARNSRPYCIGSTTKLRRAATPFSKIGPSLRVKSPLRVAVRVWSSSQMRSSDHPPMSSSGSHWRYMRQTSGERTLSSEKPRSWFV